MFKFQISDASSTEFYLPCKNGGDVGVFVGNQREYLISVRHLPPGTVVGMNYYETYFEALPFGYNIYCSSGLLVFNSKSGQSLQFLLVAPSEDELEDYRSLEYKCETSFLH
uniref:Uncharacterized protein n=1 Tax=Heterorhabditis bacteriophora TaxID=37862 RepID=A0A1I7WVE3_HETBA